MASCGTTKGLPDAQVIVKEHFQVITPDPSLRACQSKPTKPTIASDKDIATLIVNLYAWGEDCQSKLAAVWASVDQTNAQAAKANGN